MCIYLKKLAKVGIYFLLLAHKLMMNLLIVKCEESLICFAKKTQMLILNRTRMERMNTEMFCSQNINPINPCYQCSILSYFFNVINQIFLFSTNEHTMIKFVISLQRLFSQPQQCLAYPNDKPSKVHQACRFDRTHR